MADITLVAGLEHKATKTRFKEDLKTIQKDVVAKLPATLELQNKENALEGIQEKIKQWKPVEVPITLKLDTTSARNMIQKNLTQICKDLNINLTDSKKIAKEVSKGLSEGAKQGTQYTDKEMKHRQASINKIMKNIGGYTGKGDQTLIKDGKFQSNGVLTGNMHISGLNKSQINEVSQEMAKLGHTTDIAKVSVKNLEAELATKSTDWLDGYCQEIDKVNGKLGEFKNKNKEALSVGKAQNAFKTLSDNIDSVKLGNLKGTENEEFLTEYEALQTGLDKGEIAGDEALRRIKTLQGNLDNLGVTTNSVGKELREAFGSKIKFAIGAMLSMMVYSKIQDFAKGITEIDQKLTQLRIVTGQNEDAIQDYANSATDAAKKIGASVTSIMSSTETWARLGYSLEDSLQLSTVTNMFANVGAIEISAATDSLTAVLKGYNKAADDVEGIADILVEIGQKYPVSAAELGEALQNGGATLEAGGNSLEQSVALIAAGNAAIQDASKVGNALKTSSMRIRGSTAELEDAGEDVDEFCKSTSKMRSEIKSLSGVDIMLDSDTYKSTYDILVEIAEVWDDMSDVNQAALLEALAGKRNASVIKSIIANVEDLKGAYEDAGNAAGTLEEANNKYLDSIEGRKTQLSASLQTAGDSFVSQDLIKGLLVAFTTIVNVIEEVNSGLGGIPGTLITIYAISTTIHALWNVKKIQTFFKTIGSSIKSIGTMLVNNPWVFVAVAAAGVLLSIVLKVAGRVQEIHEEAQAALSTYKETKKTLEDSKKTVKDVASEYAKLSKYVGHNGENLGLNTTDYERYLELANQIADLFPTLVQGYDDEGNAILKTKGSVEELTAAYKEAAEELEHENNRKLLNKQGTLLDDFNNKMKSNDDGKASWDKDDMDLIREVEALKAFVGSNEENYDSVLDDLLTNNTFLGAAELDAFVKKIGGDKSSYSMSAGLNLEEDFEQTRHNAMGMLKDLEKELQSSYNNNIKPLAEAYLEESVDYAALSDSGKKAVDSIIDGFDYEWAAAFDGDEKKFEEALDSLVQKFADNRDLELKFGMAMDLKTSFNNGDCTVDEYYNSIEALLAILESSELDEETIKSIKLMFDVETTENGDLITDQDRGVEKLTTAGMSEEVAIKLVGDFKQEDLEALLNPDVDFSSLDFTGELDKDRTALLEVLEKVKLLNSEVEKNTFSDVYSGLEKKVEVLSDAYDTLKDGGQLTAEQTATLLDTYPDLIDYYNAETGTLKVNKKLLQDKFKIEKEAQLTALKATVEQLKAKIEMLKTEAAVSTAIINSADAEQVAAHAALRRRYVAGELTEEEYRTQYEFIAQGGLDLEKQLKEAETRLKYYESLDLDDFLSSSNSDSKNKSLDYNTFLDEQITDLQNKAKRLEDQISITEQQIANAEARGDTALANALKAQLVSQNEELQAIYHEVAEGLRRIKEEAAAELFGKGSDEYNRIIQDGEYLSEEWIAQRIRELEAEKIRIENAGGDTTAIENEIKQVEELSGVINDCTDGIYEQQSAWWDVNTAIQDAKEEIINGYGDELDRATEKLTRGLQEQADAYDILIDKKEALLEADRKEIDCQREIRELQRNIQSELNASKTMTEYLDEDTRKLLFNEDDYNHLSSKLQGIATDIGDINDWYYSEINALTEDNWYLEEAITNEYERRLDAKMKEYELAEAELNLEKKKQQLNNAMNEKNVRMYIDGSWQYVADIDEVVRAQKELAEAQGEYDEILQQQEEEAQLDEQERELDNLKTEQSAIEKQIEMIEDQTDKIKTAMEEYLEPIRDLEDIISDIASMTIPGLQTELDKFISMIRKANGTDTGGTVVTGGGSTRPGKGYIDPSVADITAPEPNASAWIPGIGNAGVYINPSTGKTEADLPVGTIITPNGSDTSWEITGGTQGDYTSVIVPNDKKHAEGVLSAPKGLSLINDGNGLEMLRTKLGDLVYMNGGETVFNGDQTRFLYNLSKNPMSYLGALAGQNNAGEQNIHNFYGDIVIEDVNDPNEFMQKLTTMLKHNSFK